MKLSMYTWKLAIISRIILESIDPKHVLPCSYFDYKELGGIEEENEDYENRIQDNTFASSSEHTKHLFRFSIWQYIIVKE